jgi:hypothetical protein
LRRLILLLAVLAAMMLMASPVLAWQPGPGEGNKYSKNYYPTGTYFKYCEPDGSQFLGTSKANKWCDHWYTDYKTKSSNGDKWYWVHVYYKWKTPQSGQWQEWDGWYYCQYHRYDDPHSNHWGFKAWVTYKPTGNHYWEWFYWQR